MSIRIDSDKVAAKGWIEWPEIDHVLAWMQKETGTIFESGSANGRLFSYLHQIKPKWKYTALDLWDGKTHLLKKNASPGTDLKSLVFDPVRKTYSHPSNVGEYITLDMFNKNCPFAKAVKQDIFEYETDEKFDVVSVGVVNSRDWTYEDWEYVLEKHIDMTKPGGITIGRNYSSKRPYAKQIRDIVAKKYVLHNDYVDDIKQKYNIPVTNDLILKSSFAYTRK
tara:strand:+ start:33551 stop:34219 length:669 start_codon:yes stop_codon:yes gene_type:complete